MLAEWTAECATDAPTVVVPWSAPDGSTRFIDLRANPYDIVEIPEAELYPALGRALRSLNALTSPVLTAKCDVWTFSAAGESEDEIEGLDTHTGELDALRLELDLDNEDTGFGTAGYIDVLWRDRALFGSAHKLREMLDRLTRRVERLPHREAALACVLRPAIYDFESNGPATAALEGYAVTLYVRAVAADAATAVERWSAALEDVTALLRGRDLSPQRTSATIDSGAYPLRVRHMG